MYHPFFINTFLNDWVIGIIMKIIGRSGNDFIAKISEIEICYLYGFDSLYATGWRNLKQEYEKSYDRDLNFEGLEIDINTIFEKTSKARINENSMKSAIETFRNMADALEMAWPALKKSIEE